MFLYIDDESWRRCAPSIVDVSQGKWKSMFMLISSTTYECTGQQRQEPVWGQKLYAKKEIERSHQ
jgi:hypothetical protein